MSSSTTGLAERRLRWFNELSHDEAVGALLLICHSRRWAEQVADLRPYDDADALYNAADEVWLEPPARGLVGGAGRPSPHRGTGRCIR